MPLSPDLVRDWLQYGETIRDEGLGERRIRRRFNVSARRARTLAEWARDPGKAAKFREEYPHLWAEGSGAQVSSGAQVKPEIPPAPYEHRVTTRTLPPAGRDILVIGDAHAKPNQDLARFTWLGRLVVALQPEIVVCIGDWADMASLCSYDRGKRGFEGRRYRADIESANEALRLFHRELDDYNRRPGVRPYHPRLVWTVGNHEHRINRATEDDAHLDGVLEIDDLDFARRGWEVVAFRTPVEIAGVSFSHYFVSGVMGRPIGGVNQARSMVTKTLTSAVAGHSHTLDYSRQTDPYGKVRCGLVVGCYFEHDEDYAGPANKMYWRGLMMLRDVADGKYDMEMWSMPRIIRRFADRGEWREAA